GGQGIINIETSPRNGEVVGTFPVEDDDHIMMVTDRGRLIRVPVHDIRIAGRQTQGVTLFKVDDGEHVVSLARLEEEENGEDGNGDDAEVENGAEVTPEDAADAGDQAD